MATEQDSDLFRIVMSEIRGDVRGCKYIDAWRDCGLKECKCENVATRVTAAIDGIATPIMGRCKGGER